MGILSKGIHKYYEIGKSIGKWVGVCRNLRPLASFLQSMGSLPRCMQAATYSPDTCCLLLPLLLASIRCIFPASERFYIQRNVCWHFSVPFFLGACLQRLLCCGEGGLAQGERNESRHQDSGQEGCRLWRGVPRAGGLFSFFSSSPQIMLWSKYFAHTPC